MKKIIRIVLFSIPLFAVLTFFIPFEIVWDFIKDYSYDGEIKPTTKEFYISLFNKGRLVLFFVSILPLFYLLFFNKLSELMNKVTKSLIKTIHRINNSFSINLIFIVSFIFAIIFMISAVFLFDIGQDPAYYLNDIQNIEKYGRITRDYDTGGTNIYLIPNLPFNVLSYIYVKLFGFSVIGIRFIIVLFSLLFIYSLYLFLEKEIFKYSFILIFSIPGIYSLTSEIFLEISALCFIFLSLYYLNKFENNKKPRNEFYSIFFMALAFTTKFQLFVYIFLVFAVMFLIETETERKRFLLFFLLKTYLLIALIIIATIIPFGFNEMLIYLNWYFVSNTAEGRGFLENSDLKLFMVNEVLILPLFVFGIYLFYKYIAGTKINYSYHFLAIFSIINVVYWLFFFSSVTWRNIIYAKIFLCIIIATVILMNKNYAKIILLSFFLFGFFANLIFIHHGVIDDVQFLKERFKPIAFVRDDSQKTFFEEARKILESESIIYVPALPYLSRVYLNNRQIILLEDYEHNDQKKSYLIYDKNAFDEKNFIRVKEKVFNQDYKELLNVGNYYLFEIINK